MFSGYISDAMGRRKPLVLLGYGLATAVKPLFPLADSVATVTIARLLDRVGKGIRGAPRDAMVSDLAPPEVRGAAFGLRQSMDTVGAVVGPLMAIGLMAAGQRHPRGAVVGGAAGHRRSGAADPPAGAGPSTQAGAAAVAREGMARLGPAFYRLTLLGGLLSLARFSEAFLVLRAADVGLSPSPGCLWCWS